jgi:hypothetical protein
MIAATGGSRAATRLIHETLGKDRGCDAIAAAAPVSEWAL